MVAVRAQAKVLEVFWIVVFIDFDQVVFNWVCTKLASGPIAFLNASLLPVLFCYLGLFQKSHFITPMISYYVVDSLI